MKCKAVSAAPASGSPLEHTGVQPDIVCMAKGIASGMPLGITMSRAEIMDWVPGSHASTFGGNPVCIAAAMATLDVIEKEGLLKNSAEVGAHMSSAWRTGRRSTKLSATFVVEAS